MKATLARPWPARRRSAGAGDGRRAGNPGSGHRPKGRPLQRRASGPGAPGRGASADGAAPPDGAVPRERQRLADLADEADEVGQRPDVAGLAGVDRPDRAPRPSASRPRMQVVIISTSNAKPVSRLPSSTLHQAAVDEPVAGLVVGDVAADRPREGAAAERSWRAAGPAASGGSRGSRSRARRRRPPGRPGRRGARGRIVLAVAVEVMTASKPCSRAQRKPARRAAPLPWFGRWTSTLAPAASATRRCRPSTRRRRRGPAGARPPARRRRRRAGPRRRRARGRSRRRKPGRRAWCHRSRAGHAARRPRSVAATDGPRDTTGWPARRSSGRGSRGSTDRPGPSPPRSG